jgi:F420-non-reducing hydrogenase small subunit
MIAFGACAQLGGIPGLANMSDRKDIFQQVYSDAPTTVNPQAVRPQTSFQENGRTVSLPTFYNTVKTLAQTVDVDYYIPGCPPTPDLLKQAVEALLAGKLPPKGSVLAPDRALCDECPRKETKPEKLAITEFKRPHQILIDHELCLLAQGLLCMGPATRTSCGARCIQGNMPCTGCFGPTSRVKDFGAKALSAMASLLEAKGDEEILKAIESIPDPVGTFYRYSLPDSLLVRKRMEAEPDVQ